MADTTTLTPLTLDQIAGCERYYCVYVASLGEDGESVVAFTHDQRRAVAAARRLVRETHGERVTALAPSKLRWTQVFDHCGCLPHEPDPEHGHDGCDCIHYGVPPCGDTYGWMSVHCAADAPGALPCITFDWEC